MTYFFGISLIIYGAALAEDTSMSEECREALMARSDDAKTWNSGMFEIPSRLPGNYSTAFWLFLIQITA